MNESLMRDLHDTQIEELTAVKTAIAELAKKPTATPTDIAKVQMMIANIKIPVQDLSELKKFIEQHITSISTHSQVALVDKLIRSCNNNLVDIYNSIDKKMGELVALQSSDSKPQTTIHKLDFSLWRVLFLFIGIIIVSFALSVCTYNLYIENERLQANDIKYRYIKMTIGTSGDYIDQIEEYVRNNPEGEALKNMKERVVSYEKAVADKLRAEEQARLRSSEATKLNEKADKIKNSK
ncbi:MAG: hypothetical protein SNH35_03035 [Rikenellaceae bacterium]